MDELETLNMLLRLIGSSPVNSTSSDHPDAANAVATMKRVSRRVQRKGWWCNIEHNIILQPNNRKEIYIGDRYSSVVPAHPGVVVRGNKLYNQYTQSDKFDEGVQVTKLVRVLDWDEMPPVMQEYTAYLSASEFIRDELEDPNREQSLKESAAVSLIDLKNQELQEAQYNIFNKPRTQQSRIGQRPYYRGGARFYGDPDV